MLNNYVDVPEGINLRFELDLQLFGERYLHNNFENGKPNGGRIEYVRLLSIVAIFILFIACVNFMNLTTARSLRRAKEVGVRKAVFCLGIALITIGYQALRTARVNPTESLCDE